MTGAGLGLRAGAATARVRREARWPWLPACVALLACLLLACAVWQLERSKDGLEIRTQRLGATPVTVFAPAGRAQAAPVVLIAHGFAGSQQLMQPFALTLARNGFVAVTFDFPGHGRHPLPMRGGLADQNQSQRTLLASMADMGAFARELAAAHGGDGRYAVLGHSMASDIVVRHAQAQAGVAATVGVSLFAPSIGPDTAGDSPRNLLVIAGALEPGVMAREALRVVGRVAGADARLDATVGRFDEGTARRATLSPGVEHIGVLYSAHTQAEALAWLQAAFGRGPSAGEPSRASVRSSSGVSPGRPAGQSAGPSGGPSAGLPARAPGSDPVFVDARGPWLGLLLAGVVALAWPLSQLLPRVRHLQPMSPGPLSCSAEPSGKVQAAPARRRWWGWCGQLPLTLLPALATPLLLWKVPTEVLPILLGDYLLLHFAVYGLLTLAGLWALGDRPSRIDRAGAVALVLGMVLTSAWALLAVGIPVDRYIFNVRPEAVRLPVVAALCVGALLYFLADECLSRGPAAAAGADVASKFCFLLSLVLAIALNPQRLFFLAIIVPAVLLLFVIYGLFSRWVFRRTGHPAVAAVANALAFGCFIAVTFPLVA